MFSGPNILVLFAPAPCLSSCLRALISWSCLRRPRKAASCLHWARKSAERNRTRAAGPRIMRYRAHGTSTTLAAFAPADGGVHRAA